MNIILKLRHSMKMTQEQFAEFCDISRISIARYEAGAPINRENAVKIAEACNVSVDYVLGSIPALSGPEADDKRIALSGEEIQMILDYRNLSSRGQKRMQETLHEMNILYSDHYPEKG